MLTKPPSAKGAHPALSPWKIPMCLLLFAYRCHRDYPLLLLANRDEFYARPSAPAAPWKGLDLVAGRDLQGGGTWAGMARGRVAAVTNIREPGRDVPEDLLSRGEIPLKFLAGNSTPCQFALGLQGQRYRGFNALLFDLEADKPLICAGNRHAPSPFPIGVHGISNGAPDAPWPKVIQGKRGLRSILRGMGDTITEDNFARPALALLRNRRSAPEAALPDTGVGLVRERALSPIFVQIDQQRALRLGAAAPDSDQAGYGTRASTLIAVSKNGRCQLWEQSFTEGEPEGPLRHFEIP
ncbi:NRDE family protein [Microbulbifer sp. 2205BS26-8]|uniref:NRDE family protein n=1 Tax=Microbulbifer sp. 2205BS26-8 TaxID=3064386 RepID=UPI00273F73D9|nr:NRDE family protein [Microbulbifer sp. 2205BS26-8]MDP5210361.1 NRDE family protein [Microbulbifer sp. 2205BS26-8]